ncbi:hypothetical protein ANOM_003508 [Aspergillus nomiae NRRL 13137]|uniref:Uncharacterized protein n=1 Tax=Aspergillus nomiae NRRL (strain ATCC 15546 / NRRL 13137 / CBS 260.88 / M93) TaxID=1509407 RepID=A0A0L1J9W2_ASPN3|nr:uncharacterized protein ANOM_003508 [Aspergillus nomiae NRRL 13137]KNG88475.1 hypothetical protein ANOM_003508 [Aspergillus nomiae NRRL 13137]
MQISWFAVMAVLFTAVAAKSTATSTTTSAATSAKESSSSASTKPTKNAAAGNALNNPFAFFRELRGVDDMECYFEK